jgi:sugar phosphate permease
VAIVKVNAPWFHLRERGGFSGIFGTMISSGLFLAFTVNGWVLDFVAQGLPPGTQPSVWWVFYAPALALCVMFVFELVVLRDRPGQAGFADFDTGDGSAAEGDGPVPVGTVLRRIFGNPVILTIALVEFCTGVLRNGVLQWFTVFAKQVWVLPNSHPLVNGVVTVPQLLAGAAGIAVGLVLAGTGGRVRSVGLVLALVSISPFVPAGWGGFSFAAGVFGSNAAGFISDLFFQSRRAPAAGGLYALLVVCTALMFFALGSTTTTVGWVKKADGPLQPGDRIVSVAGVENLKDWSDVARAYACVPATCAGTAHWDAGKCLCTEKAAASDVTVSTGTIALVINRAGQSITVDVPDPAKVQRAGDKRTLGAGPELTMSTLWMAILVFIMSFSVIGTHGLLSGTASMDFGGKRATATAVGMIDGFVYLGTGLQSLSLGYLTSRDWSYWPIFLFPFAVAGFYLCTRIWHARPGSGAPAH